VPFRRGELRSREKLAVVGPDGKAVLAQMGSGSNWPDGTIRWLIVVFEASAARTYTLEPGDPPATHFWCGTRRKDRRQYWGSCHHDFSSW